MNILAGLVSLGREAARAGNWEEALSSYEGAFSHVGHMGTATNAAEIARLIGFVHHQRGELDLARDAFELCLAIAEANGLKGEEAAALICIAAAEQHGGMVKRAETLYLRAQGIARDLSDEALMAKIELNLGVLANIQGDIQGALRRYRSALGRHERLGEESYVLGGLNNIAMSYIDLEKWSSAARYLRRAEDLATRLQDQHMLASIAVNRAEMYLRSGRFERARTACDQAFEIFSRLRTDGGLAEVHKLYGLLYRFGGKPGLADAHFGSSIELSRRCGDRLLEAEAMSEWALVHRSADRNREALQCLNDAHRIFSQLHAARELLDLDRRLDGLETSYLEVVRAWGESIESADRYTAGHCERVADYACMLAEALDFSGRDLTWLRMGGYLHDVGKIAVPAEILNKAGKLTPEEWAIMQNHTAAGDEIVSELNFPWDIRPIVRSHHERWDGSGYPDRIGGEDIPLTARILCIADVYDALTTTRSYRSALSQEQALDIMAGDAGRIFDPSLYPIFANLIVRYTPGMDQRFPVFSTQDSAAA